MILLASSSPQRSRLLSQAGLRYQIIETISDDPAADSLPAQAQAVERARAKALGSSWKEYAAAFDSPHAAILAADTIVCLGRKALGSPRDDEEARAMLMQLSGTRHTVITAQCCYLPALGEQAAREAVSVALAHVTMLPLSAQDIDAYIASGESRGRAGAYAIQEQGDRFIADIEGDRDTVIGLHVASVRRLYREVSGYSVEEE